MKKTLLFLSFALFIIPGIALSQKVTVTDDATYAGGSGAASAVLDVYSTALGFLAPRMTLVQRNGIATPAEGLLIYQTDNTPGFYYYNGTQWIALASGATTYWTKNANNITNNNSGNVGIGTSSPTSLFSVGPNSEFQVNSTGNILKINNIATSWPSGQGAVNTYLKNNGSGTLTWTALSGVPSLTAGSVVFSGGSTTLSQDNPNFFWSTTYKSLGIGTKTFTAANPEKLKVDAGATGNTNYQNVIVGLGNTNNYAQLNLKNQNAGGSASSDLVATADNGNESTNFIDMGINGSGYVYVPGDPISGGEANDGYLLSAGNDFHIVNNNPNKDMLFLTGGTAPGNERMRITNFGKVGIGTGAPTARLHIIGQLDEPQFKVQSFTILKELRFAKNHA